jgi:hypothetical protein
MSATPLPTTAPELRIDRLVLDIPGLDAAQGRALALEIAEGLATAGPDIMTGAPAERTTLGVRLDDAAGAPSDLAARIVAALIERLA